ncbi:cyclic pyranopterin monophosphate synthase, mitochondrial [Curcuma longa]|uniref:cyclic pyranopterin monophosphate synthase, mitochondrial n=1 Tax=Curcuma longa TaxID=136217 RepID=UPI003D9E9F24
MFLRSVKSHYYIRRCFFSSISHDAAITELNKEMESIFGTPPSSSALSSSAPPQVSAFASAGSKEDPARLSHVDSSGHAKMVDVSGKDESKRVAVASCRVLLGQKVFKLVASNQIAKGDVLTVAKIAGITGAKQTSNLIPLCHNIGLAHVRVDLKLNEKDHSVEIEGEAATAGKTGVEMEAMTAVTIAGLTVYDMCKAASKEVCVTDVRLERKAGGKSGYWSRE